MSHPSRILIVDDDSINRRVARKMLERRNFLVTEAGSGFEALKALQEQRFLAVLMDVSMPEMDGLETTRRIRQSPASATIPVIALTSHSSQQDEAMCLASGMNAFLAKPLDSTTADRLVVVLESLSNSQ